MSSLTRPILSCRSLSRLFLFDSRELPRCEQALLQYSQFAARKVHLSRQASWLDEYVREITGFPGGKYDDQVDSTTQALEFLANKARTTIYDVL